MLLMFLRVFIAGIHCCKAPVVHCLSLAILLCFWMQARNALVIFRYHYSFDTFIVPSTLKLPSCWAYIQHQALQAFIFWVWNIDIDCWNRDSKIFALHLSYTIMKRSSRPFLFVKCFEITVNVLVSRYDTAHVTSATKDHAHRKCCLVNIICISNNHPFCLLPLLASSSTSRITDLFPA